MGWFVRERRGVSWKDQALDSMGMPPLPLLLFFGLFTVLMTIAAYSEFTDRMERGMEGFRLSLTLLPLFGVLVVVMMALGHRWWFRHVAPRMVASPPVGLVVAVLVVIVLAYHQNSFQSWFRFI